jgi:hypothetical protein
MMTEKLIAISAGAINKAIPKGMLTGINNENGLMAAITPAHTNPPQDFQAEIAKIMNEER